MTFDEELTEEDMLIMDSEEDEEVEDQDYDWFEEWCFNNLSFDDWRIAKPLMLGTFGFYYT